MYCVEHARDLWVRRSKGAHVGQLGGRACGVEYCLARTSVSQWVTGSSPLSDSWLCQFPFKMTTLTTGEIRVLSGGQVLILYEKMNKKVLA